MAFSGHASKQSGLGHWKHMLGTEYPLSEKSLIWIRDSEGLNSPSFIAEQIKAQRLQPVHKSGTEKSISPISIFSF